MSNSVDPPLLLHCATTNPGKLAEFGKIISHYFPRTFQVESLTGLKTIEPPEETGDSFVANAVLKAKYYSRYTNAPVFCDDSGLEVSALGGAPGIYSARFAGPSATDEENNALLVSKLAALEASGNADRSARYVCAVALAQHGEVLQVADGTVNGNLQLQPQGSHGFGYDPYFFYPPFGKTLAQALPEEKLLVSHRSLALQKVLAAWLAQR